ncbi:amino acid ABC transporter permease [Vibrio sp. 03-59-1]|nr:amino acid ABC transporter permease [Vibrio sp. 03-59-1]
MTNSNELKLQSSSKTHQRHINRTSFLKINKLDAMLLAILALFIVWIYYRSSAGVNYHWRWAETFELLTTSRADGSLPYFFQGLLSTLRLTIWGMVLALLFGTLLGLARHSKSVIFNAPATAFIQLVRNIPPLVFVFIFYFFISNQLIPLLGLEALLREHDGNINLLQATLFGPSYLWENLISGVLCVGLLSSAYIGEIVRAGLQNVPKGQWEAAETLGLSRWSKYQDVIAPQVITTITPPLAGQTISLIKDSSIVALISIQELTFVGTEMANSSGLIFEIWLIVGLAYFILCFSLSLIFSRIEKKSQRYLQR